MNGTRGVELVEPSRHGSMVRAIAALVAQAPEDNRGMVLVALSHADGTVEEGISPVGGRSQRATESMGLAVGLVHHVHAHRVAQLIPTRTVRIVGQSDGIDVGLLHQLQVLLHQLLSHHACAIGVVLMAIDTTNLDGSAIDEQLSIGNLDGAETHLLGSLFDDSAIGFL